MEYSSFVTLLLVLLLQCSAQPNDDSFGNSDYADYFEATTRPPLRNRVKIKSGSSQIIFSNNPSRLPDNQGAPLNQPDVISSTNVFNPTEISVGLDVPNNPIAPVPPESISSDIEPLNIGNSPKPVIVRKRLRGRHPMFSSLLPETTTASPSLEFFGEEESSTSTTTLPPSSQTTVRTALRRRVKIPRTSSTPSSVTAPTTTVNIFLQSTTPLPNSVDNSEYEFTNSTIDTTTSEILLPTTKSRFNSRTTRTTTSRKPFQRTTTLRTTTLKTTTSRITTLKSTTDFKTTTSLDDNDLDYNENNINANTEENPTTTKGTTSRFRSRYTTASTTRRLPPFGKPNVIPGEISNNGNIGLDPEIIPSSASQFTGMSMENTDSINHESELTDNFNTISAPSKPSTRAFTKPTYIPYRSRSKSSIVTSSIPSSRSYGRFIRKTSSAATLNIIPTASSAFEDTMNSGKLLTTHSYGHYTKKPSTLSTTSRTYTRYTKPSLTTSKTTTQYNRFSKRSSSTEVVEPIIATSVVEPMEYSNSDNTGNELADSMMTTQSVSMQYDEENVASSNDEPEVASALYDYQ